ncbi:MAG: transposase [Lapillicoccus sp.]
MRDDPGIDSGAELDAARELVRAPRANRAALTGPGSLLKALTKTVIETALDEEMARHVGYDKHAAESRNRGNPATGNVQDGAHDSCGPVEIEVPRDRSGLAEFDAQAVGERPQRGR